MKVLERAKESDTNPHFMLLKMLEEKVLSGQFGSKPSFGKEAVEKSMRTWKWDDDEVDECPRGDPPTESLTTGLPKCHCLQSSNVMHTKCNRGLSCRENTTLHKKPLQCPTERLKVMLASMSGAEDPNTVLPGNASGAGY